MKKIERRRVLGLVQTLYEMQTEIRKQLEKGETEQVLTLLAECQDGAVHLGEFIEETEGEGFIAVKYIEKYCEVLYLFYNELEQSGTVNADKIYKVLRRQVIEIENSIKSDISEQLEMVFLPYKFSMWDSLESVWKAAEEDPECDAYVVPIPYFEKNAKGELAVEHYEGNQFPENVPVVFYKDFSLSEHEPDVVFIHNPYDQYNYVTSVHPDYYIPELKKYANKVVYIPYYISPEAPPESLEIQKQKEGFVMTIGVMQSDMVFLQSENMKRLYINILEKNIRNVKKDYWEKKIFGLGSPKLDRVHEVKRDDSRLPAKWRSIIYDKTGKRKIVVFYNTSVSDLLNKENMMEKIHDTLSFFEKNKDCVLWWRPHPLYESTLVSMRPDLLGIYQKMVEEYKLKGYGIFDKGEDLEWAIAESDGYYGDGSSVVQLYLEVGKPVLYQDTRVKNSVEAEEDIPIWPCAFYVDGDDIWFVHGRINVLMKYSRKEDYTYIIGSVPNENMFRELYAEIYKWEDKIYLIPFLAREIAIYHIKEGRFEKIAIRNIDKYGETGLFGKAYAKGKYLYCVPLLYEAILRIDMETDDVIYIPVGEKGKIYVPDVTRAGNQLVFINMYTGEIIFFDMDTSDAAIKKSGNPERQFSMIASIDDELYLLDSITGKIFQMDRKNLIEKEFYKSPYERICLTGVTPDMLLIDSVDSSELQIMNREKKIIYKTENHQSVHKGSLHSAYNSGIKSSNCINEDAFFYFSRVDYLMYIYNKGKPESYFSIGLKDKESDRLKDMICKTMQAKADENDIYGLREWTGELGKSEKIDKAHSACGKKILETVKEVKRGK